MNIALKNYFFRSGGGLDADALNDARVIIVYCLGIHTIHHYKNP